MKNYIRPEIEISAFDFEDIMTTSSPVQTLTKMGVELGTVDYNNIIETVPNNIFE